MPIAYSTLISGSTGHDSIDNFTDNASIDAGNGDDSIFNSGNYVMINAGTGDDSIFNTGELVTIHGGTGNDSIESYGSRNFIYGENDHDYIINYSSESSINAGLGNDLILNYGDNVAIDAGADNDSIESTGNHSTILGGLGDDIINNLGANSSVNSGAGNDSIFNHASDSRLDAGAGNDAIFNDADNVIISANVGDDSIYNTGNYASIDAGLGNDSIYNQGDSSTIQSGSGNDTVDVNAYYNVVRSDGGSLTVNFTDDFDASISGSRNNDLITINSPNSSRSSIVTVRTDAGFDSITGSLGRELFQFGDGDGFTSIWGFDGYDSIHWTSGSIEHTLIGTENITLTSSKGALTLIDVLGKPITIIDQFGNVSRRTYQQGLAINNSTNNTIISASDGNDSIYNSGSGVIINASNADDLIYNTAHIVTINAGNDNDSVQNDADDVLINGGLGNDSIYNGYNSYATINAGRGLNSITNYGSNAIINGGDIADFIWNSGFKVIANGQILNSGQKVTINSGDGDDSIITYGSNVLVYAGDRSDSISNNGNFATINADNGDDLIINRGLYATLNGGNGYDSIVNHGDFAVLFGGAGNDTLVGDNAVRETFEYSDGDDLIINYSREDTIKLDTSYTATSLSGRDFVIVTNNGNLTLKNAANMSVNIRNLSNRSEILNQENDELATLAGNASVDNPLPDGAYYDSSRRTISVNSAYLYQLDARLYAQSVVNLDASKMRTPIALVGNDNDNSIKASNGGSVIYSGAGNNTLVGGIGSDFFVLSQFASNTVIDNYDVNDVIQLGSGHVVDSSISGSDVLIQLSNGLLTIKRAANSEIHILEADEPSVDRQDSQLYSNSRDNITLNASPNADSIDNYGNYVVINALGGDDSITSNAPSGYVTINAGAGDDLIRSSDNNSYILGGLGNDSIVTDASYLTIDAGQGNDSICATGNHIVYDYTGGDGNDIIAHYQLSDTIRLHNIGVSGNTVDGDNVILGLGNGSITLEGANGKVVSLVNTRGEDFTLDFSIGENPSVDDTSVDDDTSIGQNPSVEDDPSVDEENSVDDNSIVDQDSSVDEDSSVGEDSSVDEDRSVGEDTSVDDDSTVDDDTPEDTSEDNSKEGDYTMSALEVIKNFMQALEQSTLYGEAALDQAIQTATPYASMQDAIDHFLVDVKNADSPMQFLNQKCGIILGNADTGAITGSDAGGATVKTADSIVPEDADSTDYPVNTTFTIDGLSITVPNKNTLTDVQQTIVRNLYNWWIAGALELNAESYGLSFNGDGASVKHINVVFDNNLSNKTLAAVSYTYGNSDGRATSLTLKIPMAYYSALAGDDKNGITADGHSYLDRTIAHEFTHALMMVNLGWFSRLPLFVTEGLAELVHGIDDTRGREVYNLAAEAGGLEKYLNVARRSGAETGDYSAGYMFKNIIE